MASVSQLGYLGIGTSDAKAWQDLATHILGLRVIPGRIEVALVGHSRPDPALAVDPQEPRAPEGVEQLKQFVLA